MQLEQDSCSINLMHATRGFLRETPQTILYVAILYIYYKAENVITANSVSLVDCLQWIETGEEGNMYRYCCCLTAHIS